MKPSRDLSYLTPEMLVEMFTLTDEQRAARDKANAEFLNTDEGWAMFCAVGRDYLEKRKKV